MNAIFLDNEAGKTLYGSVKDLPIIDYHCHLSPQEIYEDKPFSSITELWLKFDHYKWRLMRACGIDEEKITGAASDREKFRAYIGALEFSPANPLYDWSRMELESVFHVTLPLDSENADEIFDRANRTIEEEKLSPRKLIDKFRVEVICTTDDPADDLRYHRMLREEGYPVRVLPSFRVDRSLRLSQPGFKTYVEQLLSIEGETERSIRGMKRALKKRFEFFVENGCRVADMGIPEFPGVVGTEAQAEAAFQKAMNGLFTDEKEQELYMGHLVSFFAGLYAEENVVSQFHLAVLRNPNEKIFRLLGPDAGCDTAADPVPAEKLSNLLNEIQEENGELPRTLLYSLNRPDVEKMATIAAAFRNVSVGAAWWFADHERGMREQLQTIAELSSLGCFPGMLTDSRSFLSYPRHDLYRRVVCSFLGDLVEKGRYPEAQAKKLAKKLCYDNAKELIGGKES